MGPLDGVRVLELGQVIAGTYGTQFLADYGADVIKIEPPRGDLGRNPATGDVGGMSSLFASMNRNKRSVAVDLRQPAGREVVLDLVRWADVVIENFRPGTLERLGVPEPVMREANPALIFASVTGFGETGPYRDAPSFDLVHQAMSGWMSTIGEADGPPGSVPIPIADILAGFYLTHGVLAALYARERTGAGSRVDTAMLDVMVTLLTYQAAMYLNRGVVPPRRGTAHEYHVPWQAYETSDGHLVIAPREEVFWRAMCRAIGRPELPEDPRFADAASRRANRDALGEILEPSLRERSTAEWLAIMQREGVPAAPVRGLDEALIDPVLEERGLILDVAPPGSPAPIRVMGNPIRFDGRPFAARLAPPAVGQHTREVLGDTLGYPPERIERLAADGIVALAGRPFEPAAAEEA
jgi:crotonobetainyl-CoA:carnitine CoA-transferase CaiB-like acyl-CoA transferase